MKAIRHLLDRSAPIQGGVTRSRASWTQAIALGEAVFGRMNVQHPGEGSA